MVEDKLNSTSSNCMFVLCFGVVSKKRWGNYGYGLCTYFYLVIVWRINIVRVCFP